MKIIINADDLGGAARINEAIFELMAHRRITSATCMATGPAFDSAISGVRLFPDCSFGVHLDITGHPSLTRAAELEALRKLANQAPRQVRRVAMTRPLKAVIYAEWSAQIKKLLSAGVRITHVDSHHHTHTIPGLLLVLRTVLRENGIPSARISQNIFCERQPWSRLLKKALWNYALRNLCGVTTVEGFADLATVGEAMAAGELGHRTIEAMVHPGSAGYDQETSLLSNSLALRARGGVELVNYRVVVAGRGAR
jgi:predicted glycoside hydrolase/deacetylase ChbG (UPF0249 family)